MIDLGSEAAPRWLTSRLYLLAFLITLIGRPIYLVFVETLGAVRNRYVGTASPENVRWALARRYGRLESAMAVAFAVAGGAYCDPTTGLRISGTGSFQFDLTTGHLQAWQVIQLMQQFLVRLHPGTAACSRRFGSRFGGVDHFGWQRD